MQPHLTRQNSEFSHRLRQISYAGALAARWVELASWAGMAIRVVIAMAIR
jgi:hypothetical protein